MQLNCENCNVWGHHLDDLLAPFLEALYHLEISDASLDVRLDAVAAKGVKALAEVYLFMFLALIVADFAYVVWLLFCLFNIKGLFPLNILVCLMLAFNGEEIVLDLLTCLRIKLYLIYIIVPISSIFIPLIHHFHLLQLLTLKLSRTFQHPPKISIISIANTVLLDEIYKNYYLRLHLIIMLDDIYESSAVMPVL